MAFERQGQPTAAPHEVEPAAAEPEAAPQTQFASTGKLPPVSLGMVPRGMTASEQAYGDPQPDVSATVFIPPGATHDQVRDEILAGPQFGFEAADFDALKHQLKANPQFFYLDDTSTPGHQATAKQIATWANPQTHMATIHIRGDLVAALRGLKEKRTTRDVDAVLNTADPALRESLRPLLLGLLGPAGETRNAAAQNIANLMQTQDPSKIAAVLDGLATRGTTHDPMIPLLRGLANAKSARAPESFIGPLAKPGILDPAKAESAESDAEKARADVNAQVETGTVDRNEAAVIFRLSSQLHATTGNTEKAEQDEVTSRYYLVGDKERALVAARRQTTIPKQTPTEGPSISAPSKAERELLEVREDREAILREWEALDSGREVPETPPSLEKQTEQTRLGDGAVVAERNEKFDRGMGAFALANTFLKFWIAEVRTRQMVALRNKEDKLASEVRAENNYPVPATPQELTALAHRLDQIAGRGGAHADKARAYAARVREQIEQSKAYYASR